MSTNASRWATWRSDTNAFRGPRRTSTKPHGRPCESSPPRELDRVTSAYHAADGRVDVNRARPPRARRAAHAQVPSAFLAGQARTRRDGKIRALLSNEVDARLTPEGVPLGECRRAGIPGGRAPAVRCTAAGERHGRGGRRPCLPAPRGDHAQPGGHVGAAVVGMGRRRRGDRQGDSGGGKRGPHVSRVIGTPPQNSSKDCTPRCRSWPR